MAGSSMCERANDRLEVFTDRVATSELHASKATKTDKLLVEEHSDARDFRFAELLESVESAVLRHTTGEGTVQSRSLRMGELIDLELGPQEMRYYVVALPPRVTEIAFSIACPGSAQLPTMYASLIPGVRPSKQDHDCEGDDTGELTFRHEAEPGQLSMTLLVVGLVEACSGKLRCIARRPEEEAPSSGACSMRRRVEERLAQLRQDPVELQAHMRSAKEYQKRRLRAAGGGEHKDFAAEHRRNIDLLQRPSLQEEARVLRKERRAEQQASAELHRRFAEEAFRSRAERWTTKEEEWQLQKEQEAARHEKEVVRPTEWCVRLLVVAFGCSFMEKAKVEKVERRHCAEMVRASQLIQGYYLKKISFRRRRDLYENVIKFRVALSAYARNVHPAMCIAAHERVQWALEQMSAKGEKLGLADLISTYLSKVRKLQRATRRYLLKREARTQALLHHFTAKACAAAYQALGMHGSPSSKRVSVMAGDDHVVGDKAMSTRKSLKMSRKLSRKATDKDIDGATAAVTPNSTDKRKSVVMRNSNKGGTSGKFRQSISVKRSSRASMALPEDSAVAAWASRRSAGPMFLTDYTSKMYELESSGEDLMPAWFRRIVLRTHVVEMMYSYPRRMYQFLDLKKEHDLERDVQKMTSGKAFVLQGMHKPPRTIELARIPVLYSQTYEEWCDGIKYKEVVHNYHRQCKKILDAWHRVRVCRGHGATQAGHNDIGAALGSAANCAVGSGLTIHKKELSDQHGLGVDEGLEDVRAAQDALDALLEEDDEHDA